MTRGLTQGVTQGLTVGLTRPSPPVAVFALVVAGGTGRSGTSTPLRGSAPEALHLVTGVLSRWGVLAGLVLMVVVGACLVAVKVGVRVGLRGRVVGRVLLPTPGFQPKVDEIARFASVIGRAHRAVRVPGTRSAYAVRIRLTAQDGLVRYELWGHRRAESVLTLAGFDQVENLPAADAVVVSAAAGGGAVPEPATERGTENDGDDDGDGSEDGGWGDDERVS